MGQIELEGNKQIVLRLIENIGAGRMEAVAEAVSDDATWILPGDPETFRLAGARTKPEFLALTGMLTSTFASGLHFEIKGITAEGDRVAVEAESHGETALGSYHGRYHFLFKLRDKKVVLAKEYTDSAYMEAFLARLERAAAGR
ncbi:MAG: SnoaL-like domain-containing protein [Planctomycetes bacterium]|nr:SnoaL-like domain-containing protein [Planctomycetota bacterium]